MKHHTWSIAFYLFIYLFIFKCSLGCEFVILWPHPLHLIDYWHVPPQPAGFLDPESSSRFYTFHFDGCLFIFIFLVVLRFELKGLHLLGRSSTT
jgi:hypothetical protein